MNHLSKLAVLAICGGMIACGSSQSPGAAINPDLIVKSLKVDYSPMESAGPMVIGSTISVVASPETTIPPFNVTLTLAGEPFAGKDVTLDFTNAPSLHLITEQEHGTTVDCAKHTLTVTTDSAGVASFRPRFGGYDTTAAVSILLDTNIIGHAMATSADLDGMNGTNDADVTVWLGLNGLHTGSAGDLDGNGTTSPNDLSLLLGAKAAGSYTSSGYCL